MKFLDRTIEAGQVGTERALKERNIKTLSTSNTITCNSSVLRLTAFCTPPASWLTSPPSFLESLQARNASGQAEGARTVTMESNSVIFAVKEPHVQLQYILNSCALSMAIRHYCTHGWLLGYCTLRVFYTYSAALSLASTILTDFS